MKELITALWSNKKARLILALVFVLSLGWMAFRILFNSQAYTPPTASPTPFSTRSQAQAIDNAVYSFDGLVFSKTDIATGKRTILSRPVRYPEVDSIWYVGDKGALATFTGSFDSTPAEKYVYEYNLLAADEITIKQNYIWYIDFATGDISLVSSEYADSIHAFYDNTSQKAYIFSVKNNEGYDTSIPLSGSQIAEFNPDTKTITQNTDVSSIIDVSGLSACTVGIFCVAGTIKDGSSVLGAFKDGAFTQLESAIDTVFTPTNKKDIFLATKPLAKATSNPALEEDLVGGPLSAALFDVTKKQTSKTSTTFSSDGGIIAFIDKDNLSLLYSANSTSHLSVYAKNRLGWFVSKPQETKLDTIIVGQPSYAGDGSFGIIQSIDKSYISLGRIGPVPSFDKNHYASVLNQCADSDTSVFYDEKKGRFIISMLYSNDVQQKVDTFASCVYQDTSKTTEVMFRIALLSPTTGQVVSM